MMKTDKELIIFPAHQAGYNYYEYLLFIKNINSAPMFKGADKFHHDIFIKAIELTEIPTEELAQWKFVECTDWAAVENYLTELKV